MEALKFDISERIMRNRFKFHFLQLISIILQIIRDVIKVFCYLL